MQGMKYKDICDKYNLSMNTLKSWISRNKWAAERKNKNKKGAHKGKRGAPLNNKNAVGHGAPPKNKNAEKHGFFSKYLPEETIDIIQEIKEKDPLDILWENIQIQYAAIIRAQKIMYVTAKDEMIKELKKSKYEVVPVDDEFKQITTEEEYEFQFAWDRQATFLQAQSRAMAELRNMIKQYEELLNANRDMATEEQRLRIEKLKADIDKVSDPDKDKPIEILIKRKGEE